MKENKKGLWIPNQKRRQDQHDFPGLQKLALLELVADFQADYARRARDRNAKVRADNEAELRRAQEKLDRRVA